MKSTFVCSNCSYQSLKWLGKCPNCNEWNTLEEKQIPDQTKDSKFGNQKGSAFGNNVPLSRGQAEGLGVVSQSPVSLEDIYVQLAHSSDPTNFGNILHFNNSYLADFWNKGVLSDSLTLLAGEPGLGKSTFALQILRDLIKENPNLQALYVSAEESLMQLASRAQRLDIPPQIQVLNLNNLENIIEVIADKILKQVQDDTSGVEVDTVTVAASLSHHESINESKPQNIIIIDSIQTIYSNQATGSPGSVSQVTFIVNQLLNISKSAGIAIILIGHVTKTGDIAGPKTLEHMVDTVLLLDQPTSSTKFRTLSFNKHRFGSTEKLLFLEMAENGLTIIKNPSLLLLENIESGVGIAYTLALDHEQPLLVEVQALVHNTGNSFGRREASGSSQTKLNIIIALLEKYLNLDLKAYDIYTQILGLPKGLNDDNLDLCIALAIISSLKNVSLEQLFKSKSTKEVKTVFCGRLTLSGSVRTATNQKARQSAAKRLGFAYNANLEEIKDLSELKKILSHGN
jgi:DNA repair protein RadA/Sms